MRSAENWDGLRDNMVKKRSVPRSKSPKKKKEKVYVTRGKNKESIARARANKGTGIVTINGISLDAHEPRYIRELIYDAIRLAGDTAKEYDVSITVSGGGTVGQAKSARTALARVYAAANSHLKDQMLYYDRNLLIEDVRRVEPKKYKGRKARARFQKSYR